MPARLDALTFTTGLAAIDRVLPWGGLPRGALHEIDSRPGDGGAYGFAVQLLRNATGERGFALWCRNVGDPEHGAFYGPGLAQFGAPLERLFFTQARKPAELFWAMEEAVRSARFAAVFCENAAPDLTVTRRLQLAAKESGCAAFVLIPPRPGRISAAVTRWSSVAVPTDFPDRPRWRLSLTRCRGGATGSWSIEWRHETLCLSPSAALGDGTAHAAE